MPDRIEQRDFGKSPPALHRVRKANIESEQVFWEAIAGRIDMTDLRQRKLRPMRGNTELERQCSLLDRKAEPGRVEGDVVFHIALERKSRDELNLVIVKTETPRDIGKAVVLLRGQRRDPHAKDRLQRTAEVLAACQGDNQLRTQAANAHTA
jgi:hypothetical protein